MLLIKTLKSKISARDYTVVTSNSTIVAKFLSRRLASLSEGVTD